MMSDTNPYTTPHTDLNNEQVEYYQPVLFSFKGRIGRLRYLAYSIVWQLLIIGVGLVIGAALMMAGEGLALFGTLIMGIAYVGSIAPTFAMAVRRLNDTNQSGWLSLLLLVPFVNIIFGFYLIFAPGTSTANKYGPIPGPNSVLVVLGALLLPMIAIIGILAAIALPAYQDYTLRAQTSEAFIESSNVKALVESYYLEHDEMPAQNQDINHTWRNESPYIESIDVRTGGIVTVVIASQNINLDQKTIEFRPDTQQGYIEWDCTGGDLENKYRPSLCRGQY